MPVQTVTLPLPFADAAIVVEGRLADADLQVDHRDDGHDLDKRRTRSWVIRTGLLSPLLGPVAVPAAPSQAYVKLTETSAKSCQVTAVTSGLPVVALLEFLLVDLGSGRRAGEALRSRMPDWAA